MAEKELGLSFALAGVDVSCELGRQPPLTTPDAENVRAYDQLDERERGGSRHGLSKLINETVNGGALIQHLTVLVDPTLPGLNADGTVGDVADPSTNNNAAGFGDRNFGRRLRAGGSGRAVNRRVPGSDPFPGVRNIQFTRIEPNDGFITIDFNFIGSDGGTYYFSSQIARVIGDTGGDIYLSGGDYTTLAGQGAPYVRNSVTVTGSSGSGYTLTF